MYLKEKSTGHLVEVLDLKALFNPHDDAVSGRCHYGEEAQDPESYAKAELHFPSGETLPRCWMDPHYRDDDLPRP